MSKLIVASQKRCCFKVEMSRLLAISVMITVGKLIHKSGISSPNYKCKCGFTAALLLQGRTVQRSINGWSDNRW